MKNIRLILGLPLCVIGGIIMLLGGAVATIGGNIVGEIDTETPKSRRKREILAKKYNDPIYLD